MAYRPPWPPTYSVTHFTQKSGLLFIYSLKYFNFYARHALQNKAESPSSVYDAVLTTTTLNITSSISVSFLLKWGLLWHHRGALYTCRIPGLTPDLLNQNLYLMSTPAHLSTHSSLRCSEAGTETREKEKVQAGFLCLFFLTPLLLLIPLTQSFSSS